MKKTKKFIALGLVAIMSLAMFTGCSNSDGGDAAGGDFDTSSEIGVLTREDGSGTRSAFIELFGIEQEDENGETVDMTTTSAATTNSTSVMMTTVAGDLYSIGYISLGSLNDTVKAIQIDGVDATAENVENGTYPVSRPFNIAYKEGSLSEVAQDFVNYIMSADGQAVIEEEGYIPVSDAEAYTASGLTGEVVLHGSSSVTPVMEKLAESYMALNEGVTVTVQQSDSSTGMTDAIEGTCDIGMASRAVKDEELSQGLTSTTIAMDGIAVIVNNDSPVTGLTTEQVRDIFTGALTVWSDVIGE